MEKGFSFKWESEFWKINYYSFRYTGGTTGLFIGEILFTNQLLGVSLNLLYLTMM